MGKSEITYVILFLIIATSTYFFLVEKNDEKTEGQLTTDTVLVSSRPSFEAATDTTPTLEPVKEDIAPGMALVLLKVDSLEYQDDTVAKLVGSVQEVIGYGPATPNIIRGKTQSFDILGYLRADPEEDQKIQKGRSIKVLISEITRMDGLEKSGNWSKWQIKKILRDKEKK
ncbi:hypothetical protein [Fodinibius halophilus]|uniref:Uncharacterized protein n=1 Tax=Fodinibius halophilus TaxID=1736908 RepID=A0A6M1T1T0_9BACT|nr:hypothetical protein [Fodinibius halophilus]NGP89436.1 hypothetical protein [Fodinibius halophilus]